MRDVRGMDTTAAPPRHGAVLDPCYPSGNIGCYA